MPVENLHVGQLVRDDYNSPAYVTAVDEEAGTATVRPLVMSEEMTGDAALLNPL